MHRSRTARAAQTRASRRSKAPPATRRTQGIGSFPGSLRDKLHAADDAALQPVPDPGLTGIIGNKQGLFVDAGVDPIAAGGVEGNAPHIRSREAGISSLPG